MGNTNIIELNGKRYDANSGAMIEDIHRPAASVSTPVTTKAEPPKTIEPITVSKRALDGILPGAQAHHAKPHKAPAAPVEETKARPAPSKHPAHHVMSHQPQHAKTLMRSAVKKPIPVHKAMTRVQTPAGHSVTTVPATLPDNHATVDMARFTRSQQVAKSETISRFGQPKATAFTTHVRPVPVQAAPKHSAGTKAHEHQHLAAPFEAAIAHATSHEQTSPQVAGKARFRSKTINFITAGTALLLIGGFFAYQNIPNVDLRIASSHAGFQATMPSAKPAGFAFKGPIQYDSGQVTIGFHSNSDSRNFNIIEQASNMDSQTLLNSFVASTGQSYQTIENGGRTIYLYGSGNATWVNGNVWYRITGNSSLSNTQLVNLASSM